MSHGSYSVPPEILAMKPKGTAVKKQRGNYYVYERTAKKYPNGKWGASTGKCIGKLDPLLGFIRNDASVKSTKITTLEYGQYILAFTVGKSVLDKLNQYFNQEDAMRIYILGIIHCVNNFSYQREIKELFEMSYLSILYPTLKFGDYSLANFLESLGNRQTGVIAYENDMINNSSKEIAIDGHDICTESKENDLAERGNKYQATNEEQINMVMGYDVENNVPLFCRSFKGSELDKVSVKEILVRYTFKNMLFIIDMGFYSNNNLKLFSDNGNHYIIPLSENLADYKEVTKSMILRKSFLYTSGTSSSVIQYRSIDIGGGERIIIYRDTVRALKEEEKYRKNMEKYPDRYTEKDLKEKKLFFGNIVLRTNYSEKTEKEIYQYYKKRWRIEIYYDYFKNRLDFNELHVEDYYVMEGLSFISLISGQIYSALTKNVKELYGTKKTVKQCLTNARFIKINLYNGDWVESNIKKERQDEFDKFGIVKPNFSAKSKINKR